MSKKILVITHVDESGDALPKAACEVFGAALELAESLGASINVGVIGEHVRAAAAPIAATGVEIFCVSGPEFQSPRYSTDAAAAEAICEEANADIVIAPGTSRLLRIMAGVAHRLQGQIDTHVTGLETLDGKVCARRWFYRQRLEGLIQRDTRPWFLVMDGGCHAPWTESGTAGTTIFKDIDVTVPAPRTKFNGIKVSKTSAQTIRPEAKLLFVAGAGWCKKQSDGKTHVPEAESIILDFLGKSGASLGGSKSLVDQAGENQSVLTFMTHLNQVGQTGSTPRHAKGLSTCCHGEEPHVVGWRFISERRAINLDPNCGWARGKADVLYVADAFEVISKLNLLLAEKQNVPVASVSH